MIVFHRMITYPKQNFPAKYRFHGLKKQRTQSSVLDKCGNRKNQGKYYDNKGNITLFFLDKDNKKYMLNFNDKTYVFNYSIIEKEKTTDDILKEWIGNSSSVEF